jgi:hypothetical protein
MKTLAEKTTAETRWRMQRAQQKALAKFVEEHPEPKFDWQHLWSMVAAAIAGMAVAHLLIH